MGNLCRMQKHREREIKSVLPTTAEEKKAMKIPYLVKPCPDILQLEVGKEYSYCTCGLSKNQPFCDNAHEGTIFKPITFVATHKTNILCLCKRSKNGPFCDNSHKRHMNIDF